jgi:hypothetical protein
MKTTSPRMQLRAAQHRKDRQDVGVDRGAVRYWLTHRGHALLQPLLVAEDVTRA